MISGAATIIRFLFAASERARLQNVTTFARKYSHAFFHLGYFPIRRKIDLSMEDEQLHSQTETTPITGSTGIILADNNRKERRDDREDDRDDKQDRRQEEGWVGDDKRECKQENRGINSRD